MQAIDETLKKMRDALEQKNITAKTKEKLNMRILTPASKSVVINCLIALRTDCLYFREVLLTLATVLQMDSKSLCLKAYKDIKTITEMAENTIFVADEHQDDLLDILGDFMQQKRELYNVCAELDTPELQRLINLGKKIISEKKKNAKSLALPENEY